MKPLDFGNEINLGALLFIHSYGILATGDIAYYDENGYFYMDDRKRM
jgi:acyl-CoA synthetase (AMP-forming)/AMP-acid ligase II